MKDLSLNVDEVIEKLSEMTQRVGEYGYCCAFCGHYSSEPDRIVHSFNCVAPKLIQFFQDYKDGKILILHS